MGAGEDRGRIQIKGVTLREINDALRRISDQISRLEGRSGGIGIRDNMDVVSAKQTLMDLTGNNVNAAISLHGTTSPTLSIVNGARREDTGEWIATDIAAAILSLTRQGGLKLSAKSGLTIGQAFSPAMSSSGATPDTISGLQGWWKADAQVYSDAGTTLATDGQTVQQWNDQSGNGRNLSQATSGNRPTYKTNILNGKPVIRFGGTTDDDYLTGVAISNFFTADAKTMFVVYKHTANATSGLIGVNNSSNHVIVYAGTTGTVIHSYNNDGSPDDITKSGLSSGTYYIATYLHSSGTLYVGANDTRTASMSSGASGNTSALTATLVIGANSSPLSNHLDGDIAEIILYNVALAEADRMNVEIYLAAKYGLTLPYVNVATDDLLLIENDAGSAIFRVSRAGDAYVGGTKLNVP